MLNNNTAALGTERIGKLMFRLAVPTIIAQLVNLLYNLVDRIYIGHIPDVGALALTGVGVCLPLIMIISAFAALISMGGAPRASIFLGRGDKETAEKILGNSLTMIMIISTILTIFFSIFAEDLLMAFGASANTIGYAVEYIQVYALGTIFVQLTLGLNAFITAQGFPKISMISVFLGAGINIILDPIFIFYLDMGVAGAAWATIISQAISTCWVLKFLFSKKTTLKIKLPNMKLSAGIILPCLALGIAPFIMQSTESLLAITFNQSLLSYGGDIAVGAMTILISVMQFSMLPLVGITQGSQPIISYNYGAKNALRVKQAFKLMLIACLCYSFAFWGVVMLFPEMLVRMFNSDVVMVEFASNALRIYMATSFVLGAQIACQQAFIALGNAPASLFLALLRKIVLLIPLIYILPRFFENKTSAVFLAEPIADVMATLITVTLFSFQFKKAINKITVLNPEQI